MDLVDRITQEIRERKARLSAVVREYEQLLEADKLLTDAFGPVKRTYTRRTFTPPKPPKPEVQLQSQTRGQEMRFNVQTLNHNPREFADREVVHVTQEPA